jgi:hypothetical protein
MRASQPEWIRARIWTSSNYMTGLEREDEAVVSVFAVDVAVVSAWGLGCGARSWEGTAQVEMAKPRPASLWLRIVEWESRKGMFWESWCYR